MPVSKSTGKPYFTEQQLEYAQYETSTIEYVKQQGYTLKKKGAYYSHADHDSLVFAPNGTWHWNSRNMHGNALDFITQFEHKTLVEAVLILNGENVMAQSLSANTPPAEQEQKPDYSKKENPEEKTEFVLPDKAANYSRLYAYLCKTRMIDNKVVQALVKENKLYLGSQLSKNGSEIKNIVFVSMDENGNPKGAYQRGTWNPPDGKPFKMILAGSEKQYPFHMNGAESNKVIVFEASIDAMSHASMALPNEPHPHRIALGGTWDGPLTWFLSHHPEITNITLALDNDEAGIKATETAKINLLKSGWSEENISIIKPLSKDWNEDLVSTYAIESAQTEELEVEFTP